ncbi:unnamed protein product [Symbiodinium microadriaticum]|nr:unnamed protein product [Symbiodinium microadriaticum]
MPDSKPNARRVSLLKEFFRDLLKPGYVNTRIEAAKKAAKQKLKKGEKEVPYVYRFLDVTSQAISEEQVTSEHNFPIIAAYCSSFAGDLPTKKEAAISWAGSTFRLNDPVDAVARQAWIEDEGAVLRGFASWACDRAQRNPKARKGDDHEKMQALKQIIQAKKEELRPDMPQTKQKEEADDDVDDHACRAEGEEEEPAAEDECLPGEDLEPLSDKEGESGTFKDENAGRGTTPTPKINSKVSAKAQSMLEASQSEDARLALEAQVKTRKAIREKKKGDDGGDDDPRSPDSIPERGRGRGRGGKEPETSAKKARHVEAEEEDEDEDMETGQEEEEEEAPEPPKGTKKAPQKSPKDKKEEARKSPKDKKKEAPKSPRDEKKESQISPDDKKDSLTAVEQVKRHWTPRFRELAKKDPRLQLDELVLSGNKGSWTIRLEGHDSTISPRFTASSGHWYVTDADEQRIPKLNKKYRTDFGINQKNGLQMGWNHFDSPVEGCFTCGWVGVLKATSKEVKIVDYVAQIARLGLNWVPQAAQNLLALKPSYDSQEDAQNPFPDYESPPGKRIFQQKQAGKQPIRADSAATVIVTPQPKLKRRGSTDFSGPLSKKPRQAKGSDATRTNRKLEQQFEEADESQGEEDPDTTANEEAIKASPKPKAKAKAKKSSKPARKTNPAPAKPSAETDSNKPSKDSENTGRAKPNKDSENTGRTKPKDSGNTGRTKPTKEGGSEPEDPKDKTARSSKDPMPRSPKKSTKPSAAKPPSPEKKKPTTSNDKEQEEQSLDDKKKVAHRMYMRFYRSIHSKNKMSSLYEDFLQTEGNWRNSMVYKSIKSTTKNGRRGIRRWLTRRQLLATFDTKEIVDSIIARKETDEYLRSTEVREHPDCPGLVQYLVLVEEEVTDEDMDEITDMFRLEDAGSSVDDDSDSGSDDDGDDNDTPASKTKVRKDKSKKDKKNQKAATKEDKEAEAEKARFKKTKQDANKAIGQLSKMIRDHNTKSKSVQDALRKDINDAVHRLTACRADLQAAIDGHEEQQMLSMTQAANELMQNMQDAAGALLPAPLTKMGSFSGKNNARDFARSVRLPVVLAYAPDYVQTILKKKSDSQEEERVKIPVLMPHKILSFLFEELGLTIDADTVSKYWAHCKRHCPWAGSDDFDGTHIPVSLYGDTARYGQGYDQSKVTGCFMMFLVENGYFGDPDANSLHKLFLIAFRDFKAFQKALHHQLKDVTIRRLNTRLHHTFREEDAMRWLKGAWADFAIVNKPEAE